MNHTNKTKHIEVLVLDTNPNGYTIEVHRRDTT